MRAIFVARLNNEFEYDELGQVTSKTSDIASNKSGKSFTIETMTKWNDLKQPLKLIAVVRTQDSITYAFIRDTFALTYTYNSDGVAQIDSSRYTSSTPVFSHSVVKPSISVTVGINRTSFRIPMNEMRNGVVCRFDGKVSRIIAPTTPGFYTVEHAGLSRGVYIFSASGIDHRFVVK